MHRQRATSNNHFEKLYRIYRLEEDWCTPPEHLPLIYHTLGTVDLDPGSTEKANNEFLKADRIFTKEDDALNREEPWKGNVYCFPPTYGRCSYNKHRGSWRWSLRGGFGAQSPSTAWFKRLEKDWKLGYINSALFYTISPEVMRTTPQIWDYPICIPAKRPKLLHGRSFYQIENFPKWGFFVFLPPNEPGFNRLDKFEEAFSTLGKVIL